MELSKTQIDNLVWIFYMSCIGSSKASRTNQRTLKSLIRKDLVRYHPADHTRVTTTTAGSKLVLTHYHHLVVAISTECIGLSYPPTVVEEALIRMPSENLPIYLAHKDPRVRELAREVMGRANGTD